MRGIVGASMASLLGLLICVAPTLVGVWYAIRPSERGLALMKPLTLAATFSALCGLVLAIANGALVASTLADINLAGVRLIGAVLSEGLAPVVASFACLTVAWACVAIGTRRL
ncbi:hypothetical protein [Bryobacter aggregatus]|uniref:hypothetical protein n=1 Tax=Bryobacter aggregatus TaxID=360054 RepID=UPI0004E13639|nr:hypothetical protein [Bryobacter aggregatus]